MSVQAEEACRRRDRNGINLGLGIGNSKKTTNTQDQANRASTRHAEQTNFARGRKPDALKALKADTEDGIVGTGTTRRREKRLRPPKSMRGKGGRTPQSYSECIDRALMHGALSKWGSRNRDSRCIPDVEGMLALVKLGKRSIDRGIKWAAMLEYCRETRK